MSRKQDYGGSSKVLLRKMLAASFDGQLIDLRREDEVAELLLRLSDRVFSNATFTGYAVLVSQFVGCFRERRACRKSAEMR